PDGQTFLTTQGGLVRLWEVAGLRLPQEQRLNLHLEIAGLDFSRDTGKILVRHSPGPDPLDGRLTTVFRLCATDTGLPLGPPIKRLGEVDRALAVAPEGETVATS